MDEIANQKKTNKMGRLKIFFGYAAGVGKTYSMLKAAHKEKDEGKDVVAGYIEKHTRPDTLALLDGLEIIEDKIIEYKGIELREFDIDEALRRNPQIILVDELAHTNAHGSRHAKRYQDIEELLRHGIDVYTTLNVQHLESLNDIVQSVTKVYVSERVADYVFDDADQVELVDIEPDELLLRLRAGKVYQKDQAARAMNHFFTRDNLKALREIALRRMADRLSRNAMESGDDKLQMVGEHILVCLSAAPSNPKVIRTAARLAEAFHSSLTGIYVKTFDDDNELSENFRDNIRLAEQLGARIVTVYGEDPAEQIARYAKLKGITKIVLGRANNKGIIKKKTHADRLNSISGEIDIYIIPDDRPAYNDKTSKLMLKEQWKRDFFYLNKFDLLKTIGVLLGTTLVSFIFYYMKLNLANIITVYILGVLVSAIVTDGHIYGIISSLLSVTLFNLFFTEPRFTLSVKDPTYPITLVIMLIASLLTSTLTKRVKREAYLSAQKAYYLELLMNSSKNLSAAKDQEEIIKSAAIQISQLLERPIYYSLYDGGSKLGFKAYPSDVSIEIDKKEMVAAKWVSRNNKHAGATTNTMSDLKNLYLSVRGYNDVMGVVAISMLGYPEINQVEKNLVLSLLDECGIIIERRRLAEEKERVVFETHREKLRSNLLRSISHDFRTPLTGISGSALMLLENKLSEDKKKEMYRSIYEDSMWLVDLTENLLSITRIKNGPINLNISPELVDDIITDAIAHVNRKISQYDLNVEIEDEMLMVNADGRLIVQVMANLLNNAIKFTEEGGKIDIRARRIGRNDGELNTNEKAITNNDMIEISVSDNGPGIHGDARNHVFDMFYSSESEKVDTRRGIGLGLSLCQSIVNAHGGEIKLEDNVPSGAVFVFTLPAVDLDKIS